MTAPFNYDWFYGPAFQQQADEARWRCTMLHFPDVGPDEVETNEAVQTFRGELDVRCLVYLRDGFSYEVKEFIEVPSKSHLTFECEPVDEQYKVGAFVVTVPFEEIVRVEIFAVHPQEKPREAPQITGFASGPEVVDRKPPVERKQR